MVCKYLLFNNLKSFKKPKGNNGQYHRIHIVQRAKRENVEKNKSPYLLMGIPIILWLPIGITGRELYSMVHQHLKRFASLKSKKKIIITYINR